MNVPDRSSIQPTCCYASRQVLSDVADLVIDIGARATLCQVYDGKTHAPICEMSRAEYRVFVRCGKNLCFGVRASQTYVIRLQYIMRELASCKTKRATVI